MNRIRHWRATVSESLIFAVQALRSWTPRHIIVAVVATIAVGVVVGVATVLIPNTLFSREIAPVWWNYPVWIVTSAMSGILLATYIRPPSTVVPGELPQTDADTPVAPAPVSDRAERRTGRFALTGGVLAWFAVGCPVCNKIALLALGYTGALAWFAPIQPFLAGGALVLSAVAMVWRLRGQVACPTPRVRETVTV